MNAPFSIWSQYYNTKEPEEAILEFEKDGVTHIELSVNEIAQKCGFLDMAYFSKTFKAHFGISPKKYKKSSDSI